MDSETHHSNEDSGGHTGGARISVPVPAKDSDLYRHSVTDGLLSFLIDRPLDEYTFRKLASILGTTHRTVGSAVEVLADNGLVVVTDKGNRKLVRINRERVTTPDNDILRIPQSEFHRPIEAAVTRVVDELDDVLGVLVFGSVARGMADRQSDIDLWVLVSENRLQNQQTVHEVASELGERRFDGDRYEFQIIVETPESVPAYTEDIAEIVTEGIPVYRTDEFEQFRSIMEGMVDER